MLRKYDSQNFISNAVTGFCMALSLILLIPAGLLLSLIALIWKAAGKVLSFRNK